MSKTNYNIGGMPGKDWDKFCFDLPGDIKNTDIKECSIKVANILLRYSATKGWVVQQNARIIREHFSIAYYRGTWWVEVPIERWAEKKEIQ